jgi:hypothetical protein
LRNAGQVGDDSLDAVSLALDLGDDALHLVAVEGVGDIAANVDERHVGQLGRLAAGNGRRGAGRCELAGLGERHAVEPQVGLGQSSGSGTRDHVGSGKISRLCVAGSDAVSAIWETSEGEGGGAG